MEENPAATIKLITGFLANKDVERETPLFDLQVELVDDLGVAVEIVLHELGIGGGAVFCMWMPSVVIRAAISGSRMIFATADCKRATIGAGTPAEDCSPSIVATLKPL